MLENVPGARADVRAKVVDCRVLMGSGYTVGLTFEETGEGDERDKTPALDHYEILQVSSKPDPETIHRVYRLQAQRFHPDNGETGHAETFRAIAEAYWKPRKQAGRLESIC